MVPLDKFLEAVNILVKIQENELWYILLYLSRQLEKLQSGTKRRRIQ
jgi:hypothetical protein